jgi:hypothetical protein
MSHFTTVETEITSLTALAAAAAKLGKPFEQGEVDVRGWHGNRMRAQAKIDMGSYDVAIVREKRPEERYKMVADWWAIGMEQGRQSDEVIAELTREYALERVVESCEAEGYVIDRNEIAIHADGSMELVASKWE